MTVALAAVLTALHLEDNHLVAFNERVHNFTHYLCTLYGGGTYLHSTIRVNEQYFVKFNSLAGLNILHVMHEELVALLDLELLTLNFYNCVHSLYL